MKSPAELQAVLRRHWENSALREARLLGATDVWPLVVAIRRPSPWLFRTELDAVKRHVEAWRNVTVGEVVWDSVRYRAADAPVDIPVAWKLRKPSEWLSACGDNAMKQEFHALVILAEQTDSIFHAQFVRRRSLWRGKPLAEVLQAAQLAMALEAGIARGRPLRTLSIAGIDTKFFERHESLVTALLDTRFDGEVSKIGLEVFLGALAEGEHWLLVVDLDGALLPFQKQRVRSSELNDVALPGERLLIVENENCQHLLPRVPNTVAVLGAGFDLSWLSRLRTSKKRIGYWGDIDTWGLQFLATARESIGELEALLMTASIYSRFAASAVPEPVVASTEAPRALTQSEQSLYIQLLNEARGRLEQEFIAEDLARETILNWSIS